MCWGCFDKLLDTVIRLSPPGCLQHWAFHDVGRAAAGENTAKSDREGSCNRDCGEEEGREGSGGGCDGLEGPAVDQPRDQRGTQC